MRKNQYLLKAIPLLSTFFFLSSLPAYATENISHWKKIAPQGGDIHNIFFSPSHPGLVHAFSGGFILKSYDAGNNWTVLPKQTIAPDEPDFFAVNHLNPEIMFSVSKGGDLLKSTDSGLHWQLIASNLNIDIRSFFTLNTEFSESLKILTYSDDYSNRLIASSEDGGKSWVQTNFSAEINFSGGTKEQPYFSIVAVDPKNTAIIYGTYYDLHRNQYILNKSTDAGLNWFNIMPSISTTKKEINTSTATEKIIFRPPTYLYTDNFTVHPMDSQKLYYFFGAPMVSDDGGKTWDPINPTGKDKIIAQLYIDPTEVNTLYANIQPHHSIYIDIPMEKRPARTVQIAKSIDSGKSWSIIDEHKIHEYAQLFSREIIVNPHNNQHLLRATSIGVSSSHDGGQNWQQSNQGFNLLSGQLTVATDTPAVMYLTHPYMGFYAQYRSFDAGKHWENFSTKTSDFLCQTFVINPTNHREILCPSFDRLYKSTDAGDHWELIRNYPRFFFASYAHDGKTIYLNSEYQMSKSKDKGKTWTDVSVDVSIQNQLIIDPTNVDIIYGVGRKDRLSHIYKSIDGGSSWKILFSPAAANWALGSLVMHSNDSHKLLYYNGENTYFLSDNSGENWQQILTPHIASEEYVQENRIPDFTVAHPYFRGLLFNPTKPNSIVAETEKGLVESSDRGVNWTLFSEKIESHSVMYLNAIAHNLYATTSSGLYQLTNSFNKRTEICSTGCD